MTENEVKKLSYDAVIAALNAEIAANQDFPLQETSIGIDNVPFQVPREGIWVYLAARIEDQEQIAQGGPDGGIWENFGVFEGAVYAPVDTGTKDADEVARVIKESLFNMRLDDVWYDKTYSTDQGRVEFEGATWYKISVQAEFRYDESAG